MDKTGFSHPPCRPEPLRSIRRQRQRRTVSVLVMAVLSAAWTVQIARPVDAGAGGGSAEPAPAPRPAAVDLPDVEPDQPASMASPRRNGPWVLPRRDAAVQLVAQSSRGVPFVALAAYQRAETVISAADPTCGVDWAMLAAVGRVESDHGRSGSNIVGLDGISRPGVYGVPLDGTRNTQAISDTDGGRFDRDQTWDRAVGPMQFIPATWREVAVDADADGERNPQDIDDAALASAVYLCAGEGDLTTGAGRRVALLRYNPSQAYGDLVLRIRKIYLQQGATADVGLSGGAVSALPHGNGSGLGGVRSQGARADKVSPGRTPTPQKSPAVQPGPKAPDKPTDDPTSVAPLKEAVDAVEQAVMPVLSDLQATLTCAARGLDVLLDAAAWKRCIASMASPDGH